MSTLAPPRPAPPLERTASAPARPVPAMSAPATPRASLRQMIVGLIALPLTALPFVGYMTLTPEGRLVRDRALVALSPPTLPQLSAPARVAAVAAAPRYERAVMALAYHGIGSASDGEGGFVISPKRFGEHLATLKAAGMHAVTAADVADAFQGGPALPPNAVMITFDDGRADAMMFADPLLRQAEMSATMFVIAGSASKPGVYYASWDKIASYARSGRWDIQSHTTASHREQKADGGESLPVLTSRARGESLADYRTRIREDLAHAAGAIEKHVGRRPVAFAYPFGAYGADRTNDPAIAQILREEVERYYALAFQQDDQDTVPLLTETDDRLRLRRLEVGNWSGMELLERIRRAQDQAGVELAPPLSTTAPASAPTEAGSSLAVGPPPAPTGTVPSSPGTPVTPAQASGATGARVNVPAATVPGATVPGATTGGSPATTVTSPPPASPPATASPSTVVTTPPTTRPPPTSPPTTARPPTTSPPSTSPPTTTCQQAGNSGKCVPGQGGRG